MVIRRLLSRRVDGLIISPVYRLAPVAPIYQELQESETPVVILGHRAPFSAAFPSVETEDVLGSEIATRHLLELGHRGIAFLAGPSVAPWAQERLEGYKRALRDQSIEPDEHLVFSAGGSIEDGRNAALQMLGEGVKATAIQAATDMIAIGASSVLLKQGWKIPDDISVIGFGNVLLSDHLTVPLTTIRQPKFRLGKAAMETLRKLLKHEPVDSQRLPCELIIRQSTGAPKSNVASVSR
jgi:LacI family transcriptional regulator